MKTRSVLVYCPGYPADTNALMPNRILAAAAGCLLDAGHATRIYDYGTVETVERLLEGKLSDAARSAGDSILSDSGLNPLHTLHTLWQIRGVDRLFSRRLTGLCHEIAERLVNHRGLHFAGFLINSVEDLPYAALIASRLRVSRPKLRILAFGPIVDLFAESILHDYRTFDCLCQGDIESSLVALAEKVDTPHAWSTIPNLYFRTGSQTVTTQRHDGTSLGSHPAPAYEPDTYPALRAEQKLKMFELEDSRGCSVFGNAHPLPRVGAPVRMKPVASVCNEMWRIATLYGARAFSLCGPDASASHMTAVAHELLRRRMDVTYSRTSNIRGNVAAMFGALQASGCVAMSFIVDAGSQRLLDDFYGREITVTEIESVLRASKEAGIYTIARFTYPCPADDYHTRAESVRLLDRTRPHAAPVDVPHVLPHSRWYRDSASFGYRFRPDRLLSRSVARARKFPLLPNMWPLVPVDYDRMSASQIVAGQRDLVAEFERRGVVASAPEALIRLARLAGYTDREREFVSRVQEDLVTGDTAGIATLVDQFNEAVCVPAKGVALRPFDSLRLAVGN